MHGINLAVWPSLPEFIDSVLFKFAKVAVHLRNLTPLMAFSGKNVLDRMILPIGSIFTSFRRFGEAEGQAYT